MSTRCRIAFEKDNGERRTNAQIRNDMKDFLQYILDQWELDTKEVQDMAEKLLNNMTER